MKPRSELEKRIIKLHKTLPKITNKQKEWAIKLCKPLVYKTKHTSVCFECGHGWKEELNLSTKILGSDCPKCGKKLKPAPNKSWRHKYWDYFEILTTCEEFQVIRCVYIARHYRKGTPVSWSIHEVYQHWITPEGKMKIIAIKSNSFQSYYRGILWCFGTEMEIKNTGDKYLIRGNKICPGRKVIRNVRRNGFKGKFYDFTHWDFFILILTSSIAETLLKNGYIGLLSQMDSAYTRRDVVKYWNSIKICFRNNYHPEDAKMWLDHIGLLEYFHRDLHNPKYICPKNLKEEHQRLILKKRNLERKNKLAELKQKISDANKVYRKEKKNFLKLKFSNGIIDVIVLDSVTEFYNEGTMLSHCIFENEYYAEDNLILSARKGEERLETIELSLKNFKVLQARGGNNEVTKYHKDILNLINQNVPLIKKAARA